MSTVTGILLIAGALLALAGSVGLLTMRTFYERVHPPTMGATLGAALVIAACIVHFSGTQGRLVLHHILIGLFLLVTTPVTFMMLVRAALYRDAAEGQDHLATRVEPEMTIPKAVMPDSIRHPPRSGDSARSQMDCGSSPQ